jgi:serine/threonine-protein kinase
VVAVNDAVHDSRPPGDLYCPTCERTYLDGVHCPSDGTRLVRIKAQIDPLIGRNLDGRYTILEKLGQGGMGAVYRGTQHSVGREIAIKVISAHLVADRDAIKRFLREAKLASRLSHPNAVSVMEFGQTDDGLLYLVMELVAGRTLDQVLKSDRVLRPERIVRIGTQVCDALEGAHALQIVHRDLKPANIMLLSQGRDLVKVLDFGLAKSVAPDQAATTMTNAGALLGTPAYMPPELALGGTCDGRADLYSLGVILFLLGSGRLPFESESAHELIAMHGHERAPAMTGVPPALAAVIDRLLEKDPNDRFQSATEAREALDASLDSRMATTPPAGTPFKGGDTSPSLGPFPATSQQFAHLADTPPPKARSQTELHRLVSSDTIVAGMSSSAGGNAASANSVVDALPARRSRGWLIPVLALAMIGAGAGAFVVMRGANKPTTEPAIAPHEPSAIVTPPPALTPTPTPAPTAPPSPSPTPAPTAGSAAVAERPPEPALPATATQKPATATQKPAVMTVKKTDKRGKPATTTAKTKPTTGTTAATPFKPSTGGINPSSTPPPTTKPATGSGSAAPNKGLPF